MNTEDLTMRELPEHERHRRQRWWMCIAGLYGIWLATVTAIVLLPQREEAAAAGALVMTGLAETHQDFGSHASVVLRQLRRP